MSERTLRHDDWTSAEAHPGGELPPSFAVQPHHPKLAGVARIFDGLVIVLSLWLIARVWDYYSGREYAFTESYAAYAVSGVLLFQVIADYNEVYAFWRVRRIRDEIVPILLSWGLAALILISVGFFSKSISEMSRAVIGSWLALTGFLLASMHGTGRFVFRYLRSHGLNTRRVAIAGATDLGIRLGGLFRSGPWRGYNVRGFYDDRAPTGERGRIRCAQGEIRGDLEDLVLDARNGLVDDVFISLPMRTERRVQQLLDALADTTANVYVIPDLFVFNLLHGRWTTLDGIPCVSVHSSPFEHQLVDTFAKRSIDILVSTLVLAITALPMLLISLLIKLETPGPALFRQTRYGIRGERIDVWKFRTMRVCENGDVIPQAQRNDPRVTLLGAILRRTSLDELPQFINVLQGHMSVVGPRPHAVSHNEFYRKQIRGYMLRHKVKPGITGLAQINGCRGETDSVEKMQQRIWFDLNYISNWTLMLDLKIIMKTPLRLLSNRDAY